MRRISALFTLLLLVISSSQAALWFDGSWEAAKVKAAQENKLILVDFSGKW